MKNLAYYERNRPQSREEYFDEIRLKKEDEERRKGNEERIALKIQEARLHKVSTPSQDSDYDFRQMRDQEDWCVGRGLTSNFY